MLELIEARTDMQYGDFEKDAGPADGGEASGH